jgi:PHD/YefM family antitoxin component YafN of YafNO toxin-antitoxin module
MTYRAMPALPVSELRTRQAEILRRLRETPIMLTHRGESAGVLVHPDVWNDLVDFLEDYEDAMLAVQRKQAAGATPEVMQPLDNLRRRLEADGLLDG